MIYRESTIYRESMIYRENMIYRESTVYNKAHKVKFVYMPYVIYLENKEYAKI